MFNFLYWCAMKKIFSIVLFVFFYTLAIASDYQYEVKDVFTVASFAGYKNFEMNNHGSIIFVGRDQDDAYQIFLYKNDEIKQITNADQNEVSVGEYLHINNNDQMIWMQREYDEVGQNCVLMFCDGLNPPVKISEKISEYSNEIIYPSINDNGDICWTQWGEGMPSNHIFLYKGGNIQEVYDGGMVINFTSINNNGYIVYEAMNTPENDWALRVFVWDGNEHRLISSGFPDPVSSSMPVIDNQNNVVYTRYPEDETGYRKYIMYSLQDNIEYKIDKYIEDSVPLNNFSSMWLHNSKLIFVAYDQQVYLFDKNNLVQLSNQIYQRSPYINDEWMGWIYDDDTGQGKVEIHHGNEVYKIESIYAWYGLTITNDGRVLFSKEGINDLPMALAELKPTSVFNEDNSSEFNIFPNPANDYIEVQIQSNSFERNELHIYNEIGKFESDFTTFAANGILRIDINKFPAGCYTIIYKNKHKNFIVY